MTRKKQIGAAPTGERAKVVRGRVIAYLVASAALAALFYALNNGDEVQIVKSAGDGWYEITFKGPGGKDTSGYMKGDYLTNS